MRGHFEQYILPPVNVPQRSLCAIGESVQGLVRQPLLKRRQLPGLLEEEVRYPKESLACVAHLLFVHHLAVDTLPFVFRYNSSDYITPDQFIFEYLDTYLLFLCVFSALFTVSGLIWSTSASSCPGKSM